jgi:hypothetical protein
MRPMRASAFLAACLVSANAAATTPTLEIELNKLESVEGACRAYLVFRNTTEANFASLRLDLVLFGKDGVIARRLAVEAAPLAAGKTSVKLFDVQGLACGDVGQMLLNDVVACKDATGERSDCAGLVKPMSKTGATFTK